MSSKDCGRHLRAIATYAMCGNIVKMRWKACAWKRGAGGLFVAGLYAVGGGGTVRGGVLSEGGLWADFGSRHAGWFLAGDAARFGGGMRDHFGYCNAAHFRVAARWLISGWGCRALRGWHAGPFRVL